MTISEYRIGKASRSFGLHLVCTVSVAVQTKTLLLTSPSDRLENSQEKFIVFAHHQPIMDTLEKFFQGRIPRQVRPPFIFREIARSICRIFRFSKHVAAEDVGNGLYQDRRIGAGSPQGRSRYASTPAT